MKKYKAFNQRVFEVLINTDAVLVNQPRILRAVKRLRVLEGMTYTPYDLRGLSKQEKEFMKDNGSRVYYDYQGKRFYIFISRNRSTGKKQLYAYEKKQYLTPNDGVKKYGCYNFDRWLLVNTRTGAILESEYEHRIIGNLAPCLIF